MDGQSRSAARRLRPLFILPFALCLLNCSAFAQQLLDRVVARVDGYTLTLTDLKASIALGLIEVPAGAPEDAAVQMLVDRRLMLAEVDRFAPPEPPAAEVSREADALAARVGPRMSALMDETGLDPAQVRDIARDNLRIQTYLNQRFGTAAQLTEDEVLQYYRIRPEEFTRDGRLAPFVEAEPLARARAGAERRASSVAQWLRDLRARAEIIITRRT